jgi:hypothetical protein
VVTRPTLELVFGQSIDPTTGLQILTVLQDRVDSGALQRASASGDPSAVAAALPDGSDPVASALVAFSDQIRQIVDSSVALSGLQAP